MFKQVKSSLTKKLLAMLEVKPRTNLNSKIKQLEGRIDNLTKEIQDFQKKYGDGDSYGAKVYLVDLKSELKARTAELQKLISARD